jgi:uncharacterized protein YqhQ
MLAPVPFIYALAACLLPAPITVSDLARSRKALKNNVQTGKQNVFNGKKCSFSPAMSLSLSVVVSFMSTRSNFNQGRKCLRHLSASNKL